MHKQAKITDRHSSGAVIVSLLVHALLIYYWISYKPTQPLAHSDSEQQSKTFVLIHLEPASKKRIESAKLNASSNQTSTRKLEQPAERQLEQQASSQINTPINAASAPTMQSKDFAISATAEPPQEFDSFQDKMRQSVGRIDQDYLKAKPEKPSIKSKQAETPMQKFKREISEAYIDSSGNTSIDVYVSPDGTRITRVMRGGKARCFTSPSIQISVIAPLPGYENMRSVTCPSPEEGWSHLP